MTPCCAGVDRRSLGARLKDEANSGMTLKSGSATGAMEMSFKLNKVGVLDVLTNTKPLFTVLI